MEAKYWLKIFDEIGKEVYSEIKKIKKDDAVKIMGTGVGGDKTTFIDDKIEKIALEILKKTGKEFIFISEECGRKIVGKNPEVVMIIDPIDGSKNFMHEIPFYCLSIAAAGSHTLDSVEAAYIKNLATGDVYTAVKNRGAYKNNEKIEVKKGNNEIVFTEFTRSSASRLVKINEDFHTRQPGCVCLSTCLVAEGLVDACAIVGFTRSLDVAAPYLIAKEAGGIITNKKNETVGEMKIGFGQNLDLIISSNKEIHSKILSILGDYMEGWVVWITGLPGSGKSTVAQHFLKILEKNKVSAQYLQLDAIRKIIAPEPKYDENERDFVYRSLIITAKFLSENGINVIIDAGGHRKIWRDLAKSEIKKFLEVYLKCPLEIYIERETNRKSDLIERELYKKAKERLQSGKKFEGIGQVPGIDVKYEETENPDLILESNKIGSKECAQKIFEKIKYLT